MKKKGSTSDFIKQRNDELRAAFFRQGEYSMSDTALAKALKTPATRFWVDPDRARDVISSIEKNPGKMTDMYPARRRMYEALYRKYMEIKSQFPKQSKIESVAMAIYSGAPEFYLSPSRARAILYSR